MATVQKQAGVTVEVVSAGGKARGPRTAVPGAAPGTTVETITAGPDPKNETPPPATDPSKADPSKPKEPAPTPAPDESAKQAKRVIVEGPGPQMVVGPPPGAEESGGSESTERGEAAPLTAEPAVRTATGREREAFTKPPVRAARVIAKPLGVQVVQVGGRQSVTVVNPGHRQSPDAPKG